MQRLVVPLHFLLLVDHHVVGFPLQNGTALEDERGLALEEELSGLESSTGARRELRRACERMRTHVAAASEARRAAHAQRDAALMARRRPCFGRCPHHLTAVATRRALD